jgi:predicted RNA-binding Zn ribbon-like protein
MKTELATFIFLGGHPLIDFVNTRIVQNDERINLLEDFMHFTLWLKEAGIIDEGTREALNRRWGNRNEGKEILKSALVLRDRFEEMLARLGKEQPVPQRTLECINELLRESAEFPRLERSKTGFLKTIRLRFERPVHLLAPLASAAADFLCRSDLSLVRKCENPRCILYFYDATKNRARRWCSMQGCGNRMKAARHYKKTHQN